MRRAPAWVWGALAAYAGLGAWAFHRPGLPLGALLVAWGLWLWSCALFGRLVAHVEHHLQRRPRRGAP